MPVEGVNGYLDIENTGLRVSQVGIANTTPEHLLSVGSNLFVSGDSSDVLTVTGNVVCQGVKIDFMEITPSYDLAAVSNVGNVTSNAIQFTNPDTGIVATGNVTVGNTLTISGFRVTAQTPVTDDLESITKSTLVKPNSGITPHAIHITNATDSTSAYTGALQVGSIGGGQEGGLGVAGNVHVARDVHVGGGIYTASNLEVGTSNLFVNTTTSNVGIGTNTPTASLHVIGDTIVSSNLKVGGSKLFVDTTNSSVGIGTNTPSANLHVIGDALISSNLDVVGDINYSGTFKQNGTTFSGSAWTRTGDNISYTTGKVTIGPIHRFVVTVQQVSGVNKYFINGVDRPTLQLYQGETYIFDLSDSSLITPSVHPFIFSTSANGSAYTTGITTTGAYGSTEERTFTPVVSVGTPTTLYYYCTSHSGMGATASISPPVDIMLKGNVAISDNLTVAGAVVGGPIITSITSLEPRVNNDTDIVSVKGLYFNSSMLLDLLGQDGTSIFSVTDYTFVNSVEVTFKFGSITASQIAQSPYKIRLNGNTIESPTFAYPSSLYTFSPNPFTFTNAGMTGQYSTGIATFRGHGDYATAAWVQDTTYFALGRSAGSSYDGFQRWTVPKDGKYTIEAYGGRGGEHVWNWSSTNGQHSGRGAHVGATFTLTKGDQIVIIVGHGGESQKNSSSGSCGGGGGTWVLKENFSTSTNDIYLIAGGGTGTTAYSNYSYKWPDSIGWRQGTNSNGGSGGGNGSSGGAGWSNNGSGGNDFGLRPYVGARGGNFTSYSEGRGGFGGGGGANNQSPGGGGGYRGGRGSYYNAPQSYYPSESWIMTNGTSGITVTNRNFHGYHVDFNGHVKITQN
tara:strand:- start:986 stop:3529 length:2544 start_codon:yes stop_codon:yes gene_type:complete